jgi:hypothetical protein
VPLEAEVIQLGLREGLPNLTGYGREKFRLIRRGIARRSAVPICEDRRDEAHRASTLRLGDTKSFRDGKARPRSVAGSVDSSRQLLSFICHAHIVPGGEPDGKRYAAGVGELSARQRDSAFDARSAYEHDSQGIPSWEPWSE